MSASTFPTESSHCHFNCKRSRQCQQRPRCNAHTFDILQTEDDMAINAHKVRKNANAGLIRVHTAWVTRKQTERLSVSCQPLAAQSKFYMWAVEYILRKTISKWYLISFNSEKYQSYNINKSSESELWCSPKWSGAPWSSSMHGRIETWYVLSGGWQMHFTQSDSEQAKRHGICLEKIGTDAL